ncbi:MULTISPECIES: zinc-binding dehydrogenase [unclassified Arsukibacterium]|uniref:zinc-binding dehydrogenase n=1 Tax=unclassified Arsukibacterium TaxID=2635278 RepID=UPI000C978ECC|nr:MULTISPECIES: zinc-binding dehydrogenase [unclassified Arsukibacterium]MAA95424.1 NADH oxidase [Rheinheimera sp.]HAW92635.1 NADH oxidase [Candidatus Azambacteria bacterium]|tara:strand:+ start:25383 stop:26510 length:1128 start_codon:yes stop_codon:yes gene_type:complete
MSDSNIELISTISEDNKLALSLREIAMPEPGENEVVIRIDAAPINPSDLGVMFSAADMTTASQSGSDDRPVISADVPAKFMAAVKKRVGQPIPVGNEGAGTVVAAGASATAQSLLGKTVAVIGGGTYRKYLCANVKSCLELAPGTTAAEGASSFVNPLTALTMVETMRAEGHKAIVHTAAASNLGQMLNRICIADGIDLVNIVRKPDQEALLRDQGAKYVINSSSDSFMADLTQALIATGATIAFDPIGGGKLASDILTCMEAAVARNITQYSVYGSDIYKQVYIYGGLDRGPITLNRNFGFAWGVNGFLLFNALGKLSKETTFAMRKRIAAEIKTTFASHYTDEVSLAGALQLDAIAVYGKQATGEKFLIKPQH